MIVTDDLSLLYPARAPVAPPTRRERAEAIVYDVFVVAVFAMVLTGIGFLLGKEILTVFVLILIGTIVFIGSMAFLYYGTRWVVEGVLWIKDKYTKEP